MAIVKTSSMLRIVGTYSNPMDNEKFAENRNDPQLKRLGSRAEARSFLI
jgi:hypothetical protein